MKATRPLTKAAQPSEKQNHAIAIAIINFKLHAVLNHTSLKLLLQFRKYYLEAANQVNNPRTPTTRGNAYFYSSARPPENPSPQHNKHHGH